jgi:hypothetical protein
MVLPKRGYTKVYGSGIINLMTQQEAEHKGLMILLETANAHQLTVSAFGEFATSYVKDGAYEYAVLRILVKAHGHKTDLVFGMGAGWQKALEGLTKNLNTHFKKLKNESDSKAKKSKKSKG